MLSVLMSGLIILGRSLHVARFTLILVETGTVF